MNSSCLVIEARKVYEQIIDLVTKMTIPNNKYNINAKLATTNMGEAILVLNTAYNASFDVNVLASLFNSDTISKAKYFKEVVVVNQPTDANCFGYILDPDAIILTNEKLETTSFYNQTYAFYYHYPILYIMFHLSSDTKKSPQRGCK